MGCGRDCWDDKHMIWRQAEPRVEDRFIWICNHIWSGDGLIKTETDRYVYLE
jgi:putative hemolysin